ncbi:uncharacterized protein BXZ73DRAFT_107875 [Epithele typhae]|uniref:uncharacterized protein n=1 Tax=Epithele typhae TaxID=378194 RepID=UPI002007E54D|nr:uncharacterized protein BXZ73DRAFT_107875 [Epithele typhae]KAH9911690.1 hypothetical protein BXZ73DRAFT_107875 [Epithele typhae]
MPAMHPNHREVLEDMIHTRHSKLTLGRIEEIFNVIYGVVEPEDIKFKDFEKAMNSLGARKSTGGGSVRSFTAACWKGTVHVHQPHPYDHYTKKNAGRLKVQLESSGLTHRVIRREARKAGIFIPKLPSQ